MKLAQESYAEALNHANIGEYEFAAEDLSDATTKAIHAIILATNSGDHSIRDIVMKEEVALLAEREHDRKEARLKKGMAEVEIFIITAERLLKDRPEEQASARLNETREIYKASKEKIAAGDYDGALEGVNKAYKLATSAVKEIKRSQGDIMTFPRLRHQPEGYPRPRAEKERRLRLFRLSNDRQGRRRRRQARLGRAGLPGRRDEGD